MNLYIIYSQTNITFFQCNVYVCEYYNSVACCFGQCEGNLAVVYQVTRKCLVDFQ